MRALAHKFPLLLALVVAVPVLCSLVASAQGETITGKLGSNTNLAPNNGDWTVTTGSDGTANVPGYTGFTNFPYPMYVVFWLHPDCEYRNYSVTPIRTEPVTVPTDQPWQHRGDTLGAKCPTHVYAYASPDQIDVSSAPASITISTTQNDLVTPYGPPRVVWYDEFATVVADQEASSYTLDGSNVAINTPSNIGTLPGGNYALVVETLQADNSYVAQEAAILSIVNNPPPFVPCGFATWEEYEAAQQCMGNEVWSDDQCMCVPREMGSNRGLRFWPSAPSCAARRGVPSSPALSPGRRLGFKGTP